LAGSVEVRRAARRDANHREIGDFLRAHGWSVLDIADAGDGCPDYAVAKPGFACLVEVKDGTKPPSARALTPKEEQVKANWQGPYVIALDPEQCLAALYLAWKGVTT
jgi:hypothetical protein